MNRKIFLILGLCFLLTGCFLDPYTNSKYGEQVIDSWFSYKNGDDDLGKIRKEVEGIFTIEGKTCDYVTKYKDNYIFTCEITYKEISETIIPFSDNKKLNVYALFKKDGEDKFTYKVYNSSSEDGIWEKDMELK